MLFRSILPAPRDGRPCREQPADALSKNDSKIVYVGRRRCCGKLSSPLSSKLLTAGRGLPRDTKKKVSQVKLDDAERLRPIDDEERLGHYPAVSALYETSYMYAG